MSVRIGWKRPACDSFDDIETPMDTDKPHKDHIYQHWKHAHEEDYGRQMVFRPAVSEFPPSRGRIEFIIKDDGDCTFLDIASGDGHDKTDCKISSDTGAKQIRVDYANGRQRIFEIISAGADKLVLNEVY